MDDYPEEHIVQMIKGHTRKYPNASFGPAHIVVDDFNVDSDCIQYCIDRIENGESCEGHPEEELTATLSLLQSLLEYCANQEWE